MLDPAGSPGLVLDANVCINLMATQAVDEILDGLSIRCFVPEQVLAEVTRHPVTRTVLSATDHPLTRLSPKLAIARLDGAETNLFLDLVAGPAGDALGDGEAAAIAMASLRGFDIAIDDRKARRIIRERFTRLRTFWTVEVLRATSVVRALGSHRADHCFEEARRFGRMHVPRL